MAAGIICLVLVLLIAALLVFLTVTEYRPKKQEEVPFAAKGEGAPKTLQPGASITLLTWNCGFGCFGDYADFFHDGGKMVNPSDKEQVEQNTDAIGEAVSRIGPDIAFFQELDTRADRSHGVNEVERIAEPLSKKKPYLTYGIAYNFRVSFVPYPIPPIGHVESGIVTMTGFAAKENTRISLPCPFRWPVRTADLKRCLLVSRVPVAGTLKELVLVNLHLEAYDSGEGKAAQTRALKDFLFQEYKKGNYVIAGGDFNQRFSNIDAEKYPQKKGLWQAGVLDVSEFAPAFAACTDDTVPTCRSLDRPYRGADRKNFQYYVLDGFLVSDNIELQTMQTLDLGFRWSDHNPVLIKVKLS